MTRYWVFNEEQLKRALEAYAARTAREAGMAPPAALIIRTEIRNFLESPEAREHKLLEDKR